MTFSPCFDRTIFAVLFLALCYTASGANILSLDGDTVFGQSFRLLCDTGTSNRDAIAQFYRTTGANVGTDVGGAIYRHGNPQPCETLDYSDAKYNHDCAVDGSQIYLIVPANNGDEHGTNWRCKTNTNNQAGNNNVIPISIIVPVTTVSLIAPPMESGNIVSIIQNSPKTFQCQTSTGRPAATIRWYLDGVEHAGHTSTTPSGGQDMVVTTGYFDVNVDTSYQGKELYCTATSYSSMTPIELSPRPTLNVQYIPTVTILVLGESKSQYDVTVNRQNFELTCQVTSANPQPSSFSWTKDNQPIPGQTAPTYRISSVQRSDDGTYACTASNVAGTSAVSSDVHVSVQYVPEVTALKVIGATPIVGQPNAYLADEGGTVRFTCTVDSNPFSSITWRKTGSDAVIASQTTAICSNTAVTFTCTGNNGIGTDSSNFQLYVRCHPRIDPSSAVSNEVHGTLGETVQMVIHIIAYPPPTFTWHKLRDCDEADEELPVSAKQTDDVTSSTVDISSIRVDDFGNYTVTVSNAVNTGSPFKYKFQVINAAPPTVEATTKSGSTSESTSVGLVAGVGVAAFVLGFIVALVGVKYHTACRGKLCREPVYAEAKPNSGEHTYAEVEGGAAAAVALGHISPEHMEQESGPRTYENV